MSSSFSFITSPAPASEIPSEAEPSPQQPQVDDLLNMAVTESESLPVGSGLTFKSTTQARKPIKKVRRSKKIGYGAGPGAAEPIAAPASTDDSIPIPIPPPLPTPPERIPSPTTEIEKPSAMAGKPMMSSSPTLAAAEDAHSKAEAFMKQKAEQQKAEQQQAEQHRAAM